MNDQANDRLLTGLQEETFRYFRAEASSSNGLVVDSTKKESPASIAAVGFALSIYPVAVERSFMQREEAIARTLRVLRFFWGSEQNDSANTTGYKGFYYHFLDMQSGLRHGRCELSTIDTAFLLAGMLTAAQYFDRDTDEEIEIRDLADKLYRRVDWQWMLAKENAVSHGWKPESGFMRFSWQGYNEALILYVLGLGSPTFPLPDDSFDAFTRTYQWKKIYEHEFLFAGPLFIHQLSHLWIDFRGIRDRYMREKQIDYFENSRRATYIQQQYAIRNPRGFKGYSAQCWGVTASDGPGPATRKIEGVRRQFFDYTARGVPYGPDDGTIAPWAAVASLPFAPEIVLPTLQHLNALRNKADNDYGFRATFNETFPDGDDVFGWVSPNHFGLNQGPVIMMIENYRSGLLWRLTRKCEYMVMGLQRAGFEGGWL